MVAREDDDRGQVEHRLGGLLDQADLARERFQHAQAAWRLGLVANRAFKLRGKFRV